MEKKETKKNPAKLPFTDVGYVSGGHALPYFVPRNALSWIELQVGDIEIVPFKILGGRRQVHTRLHERS